jgi:hypothetical protein
MRQAHQAQEDLKQRDNELEKMKHRAEQAEAEKSRTDKDLIASLKDANNARATRNTKWSSMLIISRADAPRQRMTRRHNARRLQS